jgi:hypothetical protein
MQSPAIQAFQLHHPRHWLSPWIKCPEATPGTAEQKGGPCHPPLPDWLLALEPESITRVGNSTLLQWPSRSIAIDVYDDGSVMAAARLRVDKDAYSWLRVENREWLEAFAVHCGRRCEWRMKRAV